MDIAYISALSALGGSVIGGLTSGFSAWLSQRDQAKAGQRAHDLSRREDLYTDFIVQASKVYGDAVIHDQPQIQELISLYALISRMRVRSSPRVIACAEKITRTAIDTYSAPNKTLDELHELVKCGAIDPLRDFSEAAREDLGTFSSL
jgi:hypothetical protein